MNLPSNNFPHQISHIKFLVIIDSQLIVEFIWFIKEFAIKFVIKNDKYEKKYNIINYIAVYL